MVTIDMATNSSTTSPNNSGNKPFWCEIFDPQSKFVNNCYHGLLFIYLFGLWVDSLLFYIPIANDSGVITIDQQLSVSLAFLRSIGDSFLFSGMVLSFRTGLEDRASHVPFVRREFVNEPRVIAIKYLKSNFAIDLLASLPLPQVYLLYHFLPSKTFQSTDLYYGLIFLFQIQYPVRVLATYFAYRKIEKISGIVIRSPWSGTLYILFVYGTISHFVGALYYCMYIDEILFCIKNVFQDEANANMKGLDQLLEKCSLKNETEKGLLSDAFANKIASRSFNQKYMFCFSWGLKTLSSMGQNLESDASTRDTLFSFHIIIVGLLVFADLIARMQTCMQSVGEQEEQQIIRQRQVEEWANFHQLPLNIKNRVQQTTQSHFRSTRGMDDEAILDSLPMELRCEIRKYFYSELVCHLTVFKDMDVQLLHSICGHLRTFTGAEGMFVVLEGDPVHQLLFIHSGHLELFTIDGGSSRINVGPGGYCGQELLSWCSQLSTSTQNLPSSIYTVKCLTDVEAFSLLAKDLKLLAIQFNYDSKFLDDISRQFYKVNVVL